MELENTWRVNLHVLVASWCCLHAALRNWRMSAKTASVRVRVGFVSSSPMQSSLLPGNTLPYRKQMIVDIIKIDYT